MATSMPEVGGGRKHWRRTPRSNLKAATCPSKKARIAGIPNDSKAPTQALFFLSRSKRSMFLLFTVRTVCGRTGSVHVIIVAIRVSVMMQQT
ncbi:Putative protein of unknown function [Podospora comata]|uniref:Uncharacterized protein n=1 Tax=Podospora comata TaxID=48703 RepID=A0ABY6SMM3_PODCO|nr:Putative protein of unknown function [Podospora comata]